MCYHKVYNRADMDLNMGLNYDPNILDNKIAPTITVKTFNS